MNKVVALRRFLFLLILSIPFTLFCQQPKNSSNNNTVKKQQIVQPYFTVGNLIGPRVNVDSFKSQTTVKVTDGFLFKSATVYFSGNNFQSVMMVTFYGSSLNSIAMPINMCGPGSIITFDDVRVSGPDGQRSIEGKSYVLYGGDYDTVKAPVSFINKEINELIKKEFVSGTIYFSGANFRDVVIVKASDANLKNSLFARCGPRTVISFENCVYKNTDNTLSKPVSKSLKQE